jgi:hypothetical protein
MIKPPIHMCNVWLFSERPSSKCWKTPSLLIQEYLWQVLWTPNKISILLSQIAHTLELWWNYMYDCTSYQWRVEYLSLKMWISLNVFIVTAPKWHSHVTSWKHVIRHTGSHTKNHSKWNIQFLNIKEFFMIILKLYKNNLAKNSEHTSDNEQSKGR